MKKTTLLCVIALPFALLSCNNTPQAPAPATAPVPEVAKPVDVFSLLQGRWQSLDEPQNAIEISDKEFIQYQNGSKLEPRVFEFSADCNSVACKGGSGHMGCFSSAGKMDIECYMVISIAENDLEILPAGATGSSLRYKRLK